jgi:hypothetical protein
MNMSKVKAISRGRQHSDLGVIIINNGQRNTWWGEQGGVRAKSEPSSEPSGETTLERWPFTMPAYGNSEHDEASGVPATIRACWVRPVLCPEGNPEQPSKTFLSNPTAEEVTGATLSIAAESRVSIKRASPMTGTWKSGRGGGEPARTFTGTSRVGRGGSR